MNHKRWNSSLTICILLLLLAGCAGQTTTPLIVSGPVEATPSMEPADLPVEEEIEPAARPSATLAPPPPTRTPYPSNTPVPTIEFPELRGPYLGQELPGLTPVLFAPGIISTGFNEHNITFSPDGNEAFYTLAGTGYHAILWMRQVDGVWMQPELAPFSGEYSNQDPFISPDGQRLFFASNRPEEGDGSAQLGYRLFYVQREENGWSSPQSVGQAINQGGDSQFSPSVASDGTLYFTATYPDGEGEWDLYRSRLVNGVYQAPENLGMPINTPAFDCIPYIAPDQSYLIFSRNAAPYISWQQPNGAWTKPKALSNQLSIDNLSWGLSISADGKLIFLATTIGPRIQLPSEPPGFDLVRELIGDEQKLESLKKPDRYLDMYLNIYWLSSEVLLGLED